MKRISQTAVSGGITRTSEELREKAVLQHIFTAEGFPGMFLGTQQLHPQQGEPLSKFST